MDNVGRLRLALKRFLPTGMTLPEEAWARRHRGIVLVVWLHALGIFAYGVLRGFGPLHMLFEAGAVAVLALTARWTGLPRRLRMCAATLGLFTSSAVLVHLSGGLVEMHFHFFVMVAVVTLYQSWVPFLLAIAYVVLHHGVVGVIDPASVYNHPAALANPWRWAAVHGLFILGESAACLTAWRLNEAAHRRADDFHRELASLVQASDDAVIGLDPDGTVRSWNPGAERLFGYEAAEIIGRSAAVLVTPDDAAGGCRQLESRVSTRRDMQGVRKDGSLVEIAVTLSPVTAADGTVTGVSAIARDVSEIKRAAAERETTLSLLRATLESTADGILVVDGSGRIVSFNRKFVELWGIPDSVIEARDDDRALDFVLGQLRDPDAFVRKVRELYADADAKSFDILEFNDGRVLERYSQPQEVAGETVGRVWSFRDVTERQRAERQLREAFEREQQAAQSLRAVDEMKNTFLQAVSHELRTPLTTVLGAALTLERRHEAFSAEQRGELLGMIRRSSQKLERLLSDLLDVDQMARGVLEPRLQPTDMVALVASTLEDMDTGRHEVDVRTDPVVAGLDAPKVQRIIENLVANAVKYTPAGSPILVRVESRRPGLRISVEDHGPGVADAIKEGIFEPFRRGDVRSDHSPGTGIGLALVARFAELHGGRAWVEDRPGGGAAFRVELSCPVVPAAEAPLGPPRVTLDRDGTP
jgi:PAS domain S-box-containing protein